MAVFGLFGLMLLFGFKFRFVGVNAFGLEWWVSAFGYYAFDDSFRVWFGFCLVL